MNKKPDEKEKTTVLYNLHCKLPSRTQQHHANEVNINQIMEKARARNVVEPNSGRPLRVPMFGDYRGVDFETALMLVQNARDDFMELPAEVRARFQNNPAALMDFVHDKANYDEAVKLGLIAVKAPPEPEKIQKVEIVEKKQKGSKEPVERSEERL